jgi:hypothetical protein
LTEVKRAFRKACGGDDARAAARALLDYAAAIWPGSSPQNLGAVAVRLSGDATPVRELDRALYAPDPTNWSDGEALWACLKQGLQSSRQTTQTPKAALSPLYPQRT